MEQLTFYTLHEEVCHFDGLVSTAAEDLQHVQMDMDCSHMRIFPTRECQKTSCNKSCHCITHHTKYKDCHPLTHPPSHPPTYPHRHPFNGHFLQDGAHSVAASL